MKRDTSIKSLALAFTILALSAYLFSAVQILTIAVVCLLFIGAVGVLS
jgi:hypothetical protein